VRGISNLCIGKDGKKRPKWSERKIPVKSNRPATLKLGSELKRELSGERLRGCGGGKKNRGNHLLLSIPPQVALISRAKGKRMNQNTADLGI